jgi:thioredoxin-related protein
MHKSTIVLIALFGMIPLAFAQAKSADELIATATKQAKVENKAVFVRFTASWCGWCEEMQKVLTSKDVAPLWNKYFVSTAIIVMEQGDKVSLENPGGKALLHKLGGEDPGIPYYFFLNSEGKTLGTSTRPAEPGIKAGNIGCPNNPSEVQYFMALLKKAAPKMSDGERAIIERAFLAIR